MKVIVIVQIGNASQIPYGEKKRFGSLNIAPVGKRKHCRSGWYETVTFWRSVKIDGIKIWWQ